MLISESKPVIQTQIGATIKAFLSGDRSEIKTNWKGFRELAKLEELAEDKDEIAKQLAIYAIVERHEEDQQVLESLLVLQLLNLNPSIPIRVLAPYLNSENQQLREFSEYWFKGHDIREVGVSSSNASVNYQDYVEYVCYKRDNNEQVPPGFIEYIYERSPDQAMLVFYRMARQGAATKRLMEMQKEHEANQLKREKDGRDDELADLLAEWNKEMAAKQGKDAVPLPPVPPPPPAKQLPDKIPQQLEKKPSQEILMAEHIISNAIWLKKHNFDDQFPEALQAAKKQLSKLADQEQWWVRLYVAEIMRRHRELRQADVLEKLIGR